MRGWAGLVVWLLSAALAASAQVDFRRDVEPILARRCVPCHNASLSQNGVRFDEREAALAGGYSGPVIVPGKPDESKLILRVTSTKKGFMMPPAGPPLSPAEVAVLRTWIESGANWPAQENKAAPAAAPAPAAEPRHWAFRPIRRPEPPDVVLRSWVRNPIDRFILNRLEREGIQPSPEAPSRARR